MTFPTPITATVTIAGVDVTEKVVPGTLVISNLLTSRVDTCSFLLEDAESVLPTDWQEVIVTDQHAVRLFGGYLTGYKETAGPNLGVNYQVEASDYSIRLEKVLVKAVYENKTDAEIIADLFTRYLSGEGFDGVTDVATLLTYERKLINRVSLLKTLQDLADYANAEFFIDPDKSLHFFERGAGSAAPFSLSSSPDMSASFPFSGIVKNTDGAGVVNRIEVIGGNFLSDDAEFILAGNGQDPRIILPFRLSAPDGETAILIFRNDGTEAVPVWTALTVRLGYIDQLTGPNDVLYYYQEKVIEIQGNWPALPNAVKINAKYEVPLRTRVSDQASINHYGLILDGMIVDDTITVKSLAREAARAKLAASALANTAISLQCLEPGLRAGQVVRVVSVNPDINADYLIQRVQTVVSIGGLSSHSLALGTYNPDLIDMLLGLARKSAPVISWRDDEVLDELLQLAEEITLSETTAVSASSGPYYFSEDPAEAFDWGFGAFEP